MSVFQPTLGFTRFRLFPQAPFLDPGKPPEVVLVSSPPGSIGPGPNDDRMYTVYPVGKQSEYGMFESEIGVPLLLLPPWSGPRLSMAWPGPGGHFDHLPVGTAAFEAAHLFGSTRFVLDIWERYFGESLPWHFRKHYDRLELGILPDFDNAQFGYGFLEVGSSTSSTGEVYPYSLNFDVIAHEVGHGIIYSQVGLPDPGEERAEYFGFHESAADLVAILSALHFESVVDELLENTRGNLYSMNRLNRIAEISRNEQIRLAANSHTMADFADGWEDEHDLSQPLTGAMFDILIDIFHENLLDAGAISGELEDFADQAENLEAYQPAIQFLFDRAYALAPSAFKNALILARDIMGGYLARTWDQLSPASLTYEHVGEIMQQTDRMQTGGAFANLIGRNLRLRKIGTIVPGPRRESDESKSHLRSSRTLVPDH